LIRAGFQLPASSQRVNKIIEITKKIEKSADDQLAALFLSYIRYTPPPADPFSDVESYPAMKFLLPVNSQTGFIAWFGHSVANSHFAPKATRMRGGLNSAGGSVAEKGAPDGGQQQFLAALGGILQSSTLVSNAAQDPASIPVVPKIVFETDIRLSW
jgi:hypothetical protein